MIANVSPLGRSKCKCSIEPSLKRRRAGRHCQIRDESSSFVATEGNTSRWQLDGVGGRVINAG